MLAGLISSCFVFHIIATQTLIDIIRDGLGTDGLVYSGRLATVIPVGLAF